MPNGRSNGRRRGRRPKRRSDEKGGRTVQTAAPALFAFRESVSSFVGLSAWRWACASPRCGSRCFRSGQRKQIIRTHHRLEIGSDYIGLVRVTGLEPARFAAQEPKSCASANSATPAFTKSYRNIEFFCKFTLLIITNLSLNCKSFPWRY